VATPSTVASYSSYTYKGCYSGTTKTGSRTIKNLVGHDAWTVESCLASVDASEYAVGGLTYGVRFLFAPRRSSSLLLTLFLSFDL
jgi:hypothetical protein